MLTKDMMVNILKHINVSNQQVVYLKLTIVLSVNYILIKLGEMRFLRCALLLSIWPLEMYQEFVNLSFLISLLTMINNYLNSIYFIE